MISKREHDAMLRVKQDAGWRYGPVYDEAAKTDPGMVAYEQMTFEDGGPVEVLVDEVAGVEAYVEADQAAVAAWFDEVSSASEDSTDGQ